MTRARLATALAMAGLLAAAGLASADVKTTEKSQIKFEGMIGRMMGMFGGKAAKDGIVNTVAVKGDRKITATEDSATIIDLAEEKVYELNLRDKSYKVTTFAEMRKRLEEARAKAEEDARKQQAREEKKDPDQKEMEIEFSAKETGQKRQIGGYNCRQVILTVSMHEKGKTLDQSGGMLMTMDSWLAPRVPGMKEIADFDMRYAKTMADALPSAEQMAQVFAMYPGLKDGMAKMSKEWSTWTARRSRRCRRSRSCRPRSRPRRPRRKRARAAAPLPPGRLAGCSAVSARRRKNPSRPRARRPRRRPTPTRA